MRRRTGRFARDGRPSVQVWSDDPRAAAWAAARHPGELRASPERLADVLRRPAGITVTDSPARALAARLAGSRAERVPR